MAGRNYAEDIGELFETILHVFFMNLRLLLRIFLMLIFCRNNQAIFDGILHYRQRWKQNIQVCHSIDAIGSPRTGL